jgi:subtilisin family serine protease
LNAYETKSISIKHALFVAVLSALLLAAPTFASTGPRASGSIERRVQLPTASRYVPGQVLVVFRAGASRGAMARANLRAGAHVAERFPGFRIQLVKLSRGISVREAIRAYRTDPAVASAEPNYLRHLTANPLDELFADQWDLDNVGQPHNVTRLEGAPPPSDHAGLADADIDASEAWAIEDGSTHQTVVAVIDTGVDVTQPDLDGQLWINPGDSTVDLVDNDSNGKVDDVHGWHFTSTTNGDATLLPPPFPDYEHGTHVAGTIAAELNDSGTNDGIVGVCPHCKIMVLRIATNSGGVPIAAEIKALNYAKSKGARIANLSLGGPDWSNAEREVLRRSRLLAVVAAGNESLDNDMVLAADSNGDGNAVLSPSYPASYTLNNIIAVGASNDRDENAYSTQCRALGGTKPQCAFTSWGHDSVDVSAPGVDITSTFPGTHWHTWDGTSMAAPHVAGIAGLLLSSNPALSVAQVKNAIMRGVDKPANLKTMYSSSLNARKTGAFTRTSGRVNAKKALTASTANATPLTDGNINGARSMRRASVSGSVAWPADINDVRKRRLRRGHIYRITLVVPRRKDYDLYVWKRGTKEIWQSRARLRAASAHSGSRDEVVQFRARATGRYYIQVSAWLFRSGNYTLKIKRIS